MNRNNDGASTLREFLDAVRRGDLECVQHLVLDCYVPVDIRFDGVDPTAMYLACRLNDGGKMVRFLVENGADVNPEGGRHMSPLDHAVRHRRLETVQLLIQHGANLNPVGPYYHFDSLVEYACSYGNLEILQTLISSGGKFYGIEATHRLTSSNLLSEAERLDMFKFLLCQVKGLEYEKDHRGWTPLHYACRYGRDNIVRFLIARDQRLMLAQDNTGNNSLYYTETIKVAKALLECPYNDATGRFDRDPNVVCEMLLDCNNYRRTPLEGMLARFGWDARTDKESFMETIEYVRTYFSPLADGDSCVIIPDFNPFLQRLTMDIRNDLERVLMGELVVQVMCYLAPVDIMKRWWNRKIPQRSCSSGFATMLAIKTMIGSMFKN